MASGRLDTGGRLHALLLDQLVQAQANVALRLWARVGYAEAGERHTGGQRSMRPEDRARSGASW